MTPNRSTSAMRTEARLMSIDSLAAHVRFVRHGLAVRYSEDVDVNLDWVRYAAVCRAEMTRRTTFA
jgi:hypothetical protein